MFKFFWNITRRQRADAIRQSAEIWRLDPLSHPALLDMTERELADLPMEPLCFLAEPEHAVPLKKNPPTRTRMAG